MGGGSEVLVVDGIDTESVGFTRESDSRQYGHLSDSQRMWGGVAISKAMYCKGK